MDIFYHPAEPAAYQLCRQVCQNHITTHALSWSQTHTAVLCAVSRLLQYGITQGVHQPFTLDAVLRSLQAALVARLTADEPPVLTFPGDDPLAQEGDIPHYALLNAMITSMREYSAEQGLDLEAGVRVLVCLLADVLHWSAEHFAWDREDLDEPLRHVRTALVNDIQTYVSGWRGS